MEKNAVMRLVEYVRGSEWDRWDWCKNCTQYPIYIYQKTSIEPRLNLCEQCKIKECNENCQYLLPNGYAEVSQETNRLRKST